MSKMVAYSDGEDQEFFYVSEIGDIVGFSESNDLMEGFLTVSKNNETHRPKLWNFTGLQSGKYPKSALIEVGLKLLDNKYDPNGNDEPFDDGYDYDRYY